MRRTKGKSNEKIVLQSQTTKITKIHQCQYKCWKNKINWRAEPGTQQWATGAYRTMVHYLLINTGVVLSFPKICRPDEELERHRVSLRQCAFKSGGNSSDCTWGPNPATLVCCHWQPFTRNGITACQTPAWPGINQHNEKIFNSQTSVALLPFLLLFATPLLLLLLPTGINTRFFL